MFKKIKQIIFNYIFSYEEIEIEKFYQKFSNEEVEIYNENKLKFISKSSKIENYFVEGENKFISVKDILKTVPYEIWNIETKNGLNLNCADKHIIISQNDEEIFVENLEINQKIKTKFGIDEIKNIKKSNKKENMFDLELYNEHKYFSNNILSHNTICTSGFILHFILFNEYKNVAILANKGATARKILAKIKNMYKNLPEWIQVGVREWNKGSVEFGNSCIIEASNTSADGIRGDSIGLLFLDELAFVERGLWEEFWKSTYPTISSSKEAKIFISSTPNGFNHYWKFWNEAIKNKNGYKFLKVLWDEVPGRDQAWKEQTLKELNGDIEFFNSEFNCEFLGSAGTLISSYSLKNQLIYEDPIETSFENKYKIYKQPVEKNQYLLMIDPGGGLGQDYSTIQVLDITEDITEQVAVYKDNKISLKEFPFVIEKISKLYNNGLIIGENNLFGEVLNDLNYELDANVFFDDKFGIRMTRGVKASGNSFLKRDIEEGNLKIIDFDTILEFSTYVKVKQSYEAESGYNDDLITALVLYSYFIKQKIWIENWLENEDKYNPGNIKNIEENLLPAGFHNDGNEIESFE